MYQLRIVALALGLACLGAPVVESLPAQAGAPRDSLAVARQLRDSGRLSDAASLLRAYSERHPSDGDAARLLSETLYWLKDMAGAQAVAEQSLGRNPNDTALRLQYARMLAEMGDRSRARQV